MDLEQKRQSLLSRLLASVKKCQIRYGGRRTELATDQEEVVRTLCVDLEAVFLHGAKEKRGLRLPILTASDVSTSHSWAFIKGLLNHQELDRFYLLKNVNTDVGRIRSWIRAAVNERSLERYFRVILAKESKLKEFYEPHSFLLDPERSSMLPAMAAGLTSILFAINIDNPVFNQIQSAAACQSLDGDNAVEVVEEATESLNVRKKKQKKSRIPSQIVSVTGDEVITESLDQHDNNERFAISEASSSREVTRDHILNSARKKLELQMPMARKSRKSRDGSPSPHIQYDSVHLKGDIGDFLGSQNDDNNDIYSRISPSDSRSVASVDSRGRDEKECRIDSKKLTPMKNCGIGALIPVTLGGNLDQDLNSEDSLSIRSLGEESDYATANQSMSELRKTVRKSVADKASSIHASTISREDLKQALLSVMERKDELQEQCRALKKVAAEESMAVKTLKEELAETKRQMSEASDKYEVKVQSVSRENELLKHQLKKYVGAVQKLRDGPQAYETIAQLEGKNNGDNKTPKYVDYHYEASEYEKKLIQVAEMHGELIEFNEHLQKQVQIKDLVIHRMREELVDLRGPFPNEDLNLEDTVSIASESIFGECSSVASGPTSRALLHIWIPSVFLSGAGSKTHHVYQVYLRIKDEEWNIYKRYSDFYNLHRELRKQEGLVDTFDFPPKKTVGYKADKVVEERRKKLQAYLRRIVNLLVQTNPSLSAKPSKESVVMLMPFFAEVTSPQHQQRIASSNSSHARSVSQGPTSIFSRRRSDVRNSPQLAI